VVLMDRDGVVPDGASAHDANGLAGIAVPAPRTSGTEQQSDAARETDLEHARTGYVAAVELWTYEGDSIWTRFNAMLVANSVILAFIGLIYGSTGPSPIFKKGLAITGLLLCMVWLILTKRAFDYYKYWILSARELEEKHLSSVVKTVSRGGAFAEGEPVNFFIGGKMITYRMSWVGRSVRIAWCSYLVVTGFVALYILLLLGV